eukprot:128860-Alexandrium_andersonii.AAC.1
MHGQELLGHLLEVGDVGVEVALDPGELGLQLVLVGRPGPPDGTRVPAQEVRSEGRDGLLKAGERVFEG